MIFIMSGAHPWLKTVSIMIFIARAPPIPTHSDNDKAVTWRDRISHGWLKLDLMIFIMRAPSINVHR